MIQVSQQQRTAAGTPGGSQHGVGSRSKKGRRSRSNSRSSTTGISGSPNTKPRATPLATATNTTASNLHSTQAYQPSPLRNSDPDLSAPLQVKPLKAPPSPLVNTGGADEESWSSRSFLSSLSSESRTSTHAPTAVDLMAGAEHQDGAEPRDMASQKPSEGGASSSSSSSRPVRRIRKGQKLEDIQAAVPAETPAIQQIDSPFQVQEYIALLVRQDPHNVERIVALPQSAASPIGSDPFSGSPESDGKGKGKSMGSVSSAFGMHEAEQSVDTDIWIFEQLRRIVFDFTSPWLTSLQRECDRKQRPETCGAMNADDWMYLCASHGEEKQCCAIDYIIHTLDGTTALLNSHRHFPSRTYVPTTSLRHFGSVSRRLTRIFVHAHEHHRDTFEACEAETSLYARFLALVEVYDLVAVETLPKLSSSNNSDSVSSAASAAEKSGKGPALSVSSEENTTDGDSGEVFSRGPASGQGRHLFEAGDSADADLADDVEGHGDEDTHQTTGTGASALERSDSAASRVTAILRNAHEETEGQQSAREAGDDDTKT